MRLIQLTLTLLVAASATAAQRPAEVAIREAAKLAGQQQKNVLVYFQASWCPWCKRTKTLLADPTFGPRFRKSYVIVPIVVRERERLRATENPGWEGTMRRLRGTTDLDVPYLAILSPQGKKLGDSYRPPTGDIPGNAGFPRTRPEIDAMVKLIQRTGSGFDAASLNGLRRYLVSLPIKK